MKKLKQFYTIDIWRGSRYMFVYFIYLKRFYNRNKKEENLFSQIPRFNLHIIVISGQVVIQLFWVAEKGWNHKGLQTYVEIEISSEEENRPDVTIVESLEVLKAARNANPPVSLTSCVSTTLQNPPLSSPSVPRKLRLHLSWRDFIFLLNKLLSLCVCVLRFITFF